MTSPERKYALTKIAPGDYLLPSNDATIIWRIARYVDGPSAGLDIPQDRTFWGVWKWDGNPAQVESLNPDDWSTFEHYEGLCETRTEAIRRALALRV